MSISYTVDSSEIEEVVLRIAVDSFVNNLSEREIAEVITALDELGSSVFIEYLESLGWVKKED